MKRLHTVGLLATALLVLVLLASLVLGLGGPPRDASSDGRADAAVERRGRVEVLNASGRAGLARAGTWVLRERGFDVVAFGNAGFTRDSSVVVSRTDDTALAEEVATALGIPRIRAEPDAALLVDVTVVLGPDWSADGVPLPWRPADEGNREPRAVN